MSSSRHLSPLAPSVSHPTDHIVFAAPWRISSPIRLRHSPMNSGAWLFSLQHSCWRAWRFAECGADTAFLHSPLPCITTHTRHRYLPVDDLARLAASCARWRQALVSDPQLWRRIVIPMDLAKQLQDAHLRVLIERSGNSPIELDLRGCSQITTAALQTLWVCTAPASSSSLFGCFCHACTQSHTHTHRPS